jgi:uncharacterized protein (DUF1778 family)
MHRPGIRLRGTPEELLLIRSAAQAVGMNVSTFVLDAACERARAVLLDRVFFPLDEDGYRRFLGNLEGTDPVNERLKALMQVEPPWNTREVGESRR